MIIPEKQIRINSEAATAFLHTLTANEVADFALADAEGWGDRFLSQLAAQANASAWPSHDELTTQVNPADIIQWDL